MNAEEMVRFFAWLSETFGPEELIELDEADETTIQTRIDQFRGLKEIDWGPGMER